ncbi:hypothetical protein C4D60_Mb10t09020 [Musa balbisiana]|uniref:RRM domain-containing protein n=1 Tax=Musa balbisiana TaxID=52838 RepID=A0A4S8IX36_MUSBA|nr:hypothetical protein C4D60_Mb10t09020 [Musa balbisiana]
MAAVAEKAIGADNQVIHRQSPAAETEREYQRDVKNLVDLLSKLNPSAKEFFPSSYAAPGGGAGGHRVSDGRISADAPIFVSWNDFYHNNLLMTNNGTSKDSSSDESSNNQPNPRVTEEKLAEVFANCGPVSRLRLLGDNVHSTCIAFVEFVQAESAIMALNCSGTILGALPIRQDPDYHSA